MSPKVAPYLLLLLANAGCSLIFVKPPPDTGGQATLTRRECTVSKAAPILDTVFAGLEGVRIAYAATRSEEDYRNDQFLSRGTDIGFGIGTCQRV